MRWRALTALCALLLFFPVQAFAKTVAKTECGEVAPASARAAKPCLKSEDRGRRIILSDVSYCTAHPSTDDEHRRWVVGVLLRMSEAALVPVDRMFPNEAYGGPWSPARQRVEEVRLRAASEGILSVLCWDISKRIRLKARLTGRHWVESDGRNVYDVLEALHETRSGMRLHYFPQVMSRDQWNSSVRRSLTQ